MTKVKPRLNKADIELLKEVFITRSDEDINSLKNLIGQIVEEKLDEKLDEKLNYLPSKDEFYTEMSKILKKLEDLEIEKDVLSSRVSGHEDRIEKIEDHLGIASVG